MDFSRRDALRGAATIALVGTDAAPAVAQTGELSSGLVTTLTPDDGLRVSWIRWDSGFRGTGLCIGDQILAIGGVVFALPTVAADRERVGRTAIGRYDEGRAWDDAHLTAASPVTLSVRRRAPVTGTRSLDITGRLRVRAVATGADGQRLIGPGGPGEMASDGFSSSWGAWDEEVVRAYTAILDGGWRSASFSSRVELASHAARKARIDFLAEHYPGPYATAAVADWRAVQDSVAGAPVDLKPEALEYRRQEDDRVAQVRAAGQSAWQAAQAALAADTIPAFPAVHPIRDNAAGVVGRVVVLPPLANQDWIADAGHGWFVAGNARDNYYFIDAEAPPAMAMLRARARFERLVSPNIQPSFAFVGRIAATPKLLVTDADAHFGLQLDLLAALVGEAMFVDTALPDPPFAGEAAFHQPPGALPAADASPAAVMSALIAALKAGDQGLWNALFADWYVDRLPDGRPLLQPLASRFTDEIWQQARASVLGRVYDARVVWTGDSRVVTDGHAYPGAPRIEEVDVEIEHVGRFDEGFRVFTDVTVHRAWLLQRVDSGPWRIHSLQSI